MSARWWLGASLAIWVLTQSGLAQAGCGSVCEGTAGELTLEPPLDCATLEAALDTCGCAVRISVQNACAGQLQVGTAEPDCEERQECLTLPMGESGSFKVWIHSSGHHDWSMPLKEDASGDHQLHASADLTEFDGELGPCSLAWFGRTPGSSGWVLSSLLAALVVRRLSARRVGPRFD
jgi:hypothetical protein